MNFSVSERPTRPRTTTQVAEKGKFGTRRFYLAGAKAALAPAEAPWAKSLEIKPFSAACEALTPHRFEFFRNPSSLTDWINANEGRDLVEDSGRRRSANWSCKTTCKTVLLEVGMRLTPSRGCLTFARQ